ncbi:MAG TPA: response regulator [Polyangiaceae bacterium]|nr:response regulator [Polyangiaceae bacterium]
MKALIVDDSRAMRLVIARILQAHDFTIVEASNGREALDVMEQTGPFDLALVDWNMPVMDGLELVLALRKDRRFDEMAIMMVTTESEAKQVERAIAAGASEYLMKPFSAETFAAKLVNLGLAA